MCIDGATVQHIQTVQGAKRGTPVETSATPLLLQGLRGRGENMLAAYLVLTWYALKIEGSIGFGREILALEFRWISPS